MRRTTEKILITGLILVVCAIISILFLSYKQSQKVHDTDALITHTSDVLYRSERILSDVIDNETSTRGFALTGDEKYLEPLQKSEHTVYQEIAILKMLIGNNPVQQIRIDSLTKYVTKRLAYSRKNIDMRKTQGLASVMELMQTGEGKFYTDQVRLISSTIQQEENKLLEERREANRHAIVRFNAILSGLAILIFLLVVIVSIAILKTFLLHKKTQQFLLQSNLALDKDVKEKTAQLANIFERINDGFAAVDSKWHFTYVNKKAGEILNYLPEQLLGKSIWDIFPESETSNKPFFDAFHAAMQNQEVIYLEEYYPLFEQWAELHIYPSDDGISVIFSDITEKKKAEEKILKANRLYNFISQINQMIVHTTDEQTLFKKVCDIAIDQGQFRLAWIGMIDELNQHVIPVMFAGEEREYLTKIKKIKIPDVPEGRGPTGSAIREGKYVISNDIANDPKMLPWKEEALVRGFQSSISVPIVKFGKVIGAFTVYAAEKYFFDKEETALLLEATGDIAFALEIIENEKIRTQSEISLKDERDKFAKIAETSPGLIYSFNQSPQSAFFNFPYAGKAIEDIFGFTKNELEKDANIVIQYFHPDDAQRISATIAQSAATMTPWKCEFRYLHPVKGEIWLEGHTIPKKELDESITWYGIIIDTTERKKTELHIIESEQKYRTLFDASLDGILLTTPDGKILAANPAACSIFDMTEQEIISRDRNEIVDITDPNLNKLLIERAATGKTRGELTMLRKNGEPFITEIASSVFNDSNGEIKSSIVIRDITLRKKAERELQASIFRFEMITRATNDALWEWNIETGELWGNDSHQQLYGLTTNDPVPTYEQWIQRIHPDDRKTIEAAQENSLQSDKNNFTSEYRFLKENNEYRYIYDRCYILRDKQLKPIRMVGCMTDITEQKIAEQGIIESEKRFRNSLDKMLEGIQIINFDWKYLYVNETAAKHGNSTKESLEGFTMMEKYPGIEQSPLFTTLQKCMVERQADFLVNNFIYPNNTNAWFELSIQPVPEGIFILSIDITERKKKEEEIKQSEEKRNLIMKAALDAIICFDINGIITFWNPQAEEIFGWKEDEVMGARFAPLVFTLQYQNLLQKELEDYLTNGEGKSAINVLTELKVLNRNHQEFPAEMTIVPIVQDKEEFFCVFIKDISERRRAQETIKKSEAQYRSLFNQSPLPKWIYDIETYKILEVNEAAVSHYGYSRAQFTSMTIVDIRPAEDVERLLKTRHHNASSPAFNVGEWRHLKADGSIISVEISGHPVEYNGRSAMMIVSNDITERKKSETVIRNINKELHDLSAHLQTIREEERVQIARDIHDELGQQLTGLKLAIEWLNLKVGNSDTQLREKTLEMIALIKATIQSVRRISTNLRPSMLDDLGLVAALEWQSQEVEKRFGIMVNFISEIPDTDFPIDISTALFRIYQESLTNAVRHSGAHEINSRLQIIDSKIILEIKDDGRGIDEAKRAVTKSFGLLGIKERTFAMNGTFELQSEPGKGTFIKIAVPI